MNKKVRAKFTCRKKLECKYDKNSEPSFEYELEAVTADSEENKTFWKYTPSGKIHMQCVNDGVLEVGQTYYIDFIEAD